MESYSVGTNILLKDLKSGEKYNGQHGTIIEPFDTSKGRYSVKLIDSEKKLSVRPVNISVLTKEMDLNTNTKDELSTETGKNEPMQNVNENAIPDAVQQEETKRADVSSETKSSTMMKSIAPYSDQAITESVDNQSAQAITEPVDPQSSQVATESTESKSSLTIMQQGSQPNQSSLNFSHQSSNVQDEKQSQAPNSTSWDGNQAHQPRGKGSKSSNRSRRPRSYSHFPRGRQYRTSSHRSHRSRPPYFSRGRGRRSPRSSPPYPAYGSPYAPYYPQQSFPYPPGQLPQGQLFQRPGNGLWLPPRGVTSGPNSKNTSPPVRRTPCVLEIIDPDTSEPIKFEKAAAAPKKTSDSVYSQKGSHRLPIVDEGQEGPEITEQFFNTQMSIGPIMPPILSSPILPSCHQNSRPVLSYDTLPTVSYQPEPEKFLATSRKLAGANFQNQSKANSLLTGLVVQKKKTTQQPEGILKNQGGATPANAMGNTNSSQSLPESKHVKPSQKGAALNVPYVESAQKMTITASAPQQATSIPPSNNIPTENRTPPPKPMWGDDDDDDNRSRGTTLTWNDIAARRAKVGQTTARNAQTIVTQKQTISSVRHGPSQIRSGNRQVLSQESRPVIFGSSQLNTKSVEQSKSQKESKGQAPVSRWGTNIQSQPLLPQTNNTIVSTNQPQPMRKPEGLKDIMQKESARMTKPKIKCAWGDDISNESKRTRKLTERQMEQQRQMEKARLMQQDRAHRLKNVKKKVSDRNQKLGQVEGSIKGRQDRGADLQRNERMDPPQDRRRFQDLGGERNRGGMFGRNNRNRVEIEPGTRPPWKAFIGNLPFNCIESEIQGFLGVDLQKIKFTEIICNEQGDSKGFAYVEFTDRETLLQALERDGAGLGHRRIRVDFAGDRNRVRNNRARTFSDRERNDRDRMSNYQRPRFGDQSERRIDRDDWRRGRDDWGRRDRDSDRKRNSFSDRQPQERMPRRRGGREDDWANDERKPLELSKKVVTEQKSERSSIFGVGKRREDILASRSTNENIDQKTERHEEDEGYRECDAPKKDNRAKESGKEEHSMEKDINSQKHLKEDRAKKSKPKKLKKDGKKKAPTNRFDALSLSDDDT